MAYCNVHFCCHEIRFNFIHKWKAFIEIFKVCKIYNSSYPILFCNLNLTKARLFVSNSKAILDLIGKYSVLLVYLYLACVIQNMFGVK